MCIKEILMSDAFWNFLAIIVSFVIVEITLSAERKMNGTNLDIQRNQYQNKLENEERLHKESIELEKEQVRANLLPFLKLNRNIEIGQRNKKHVFPLQIKNCGNSGAFDIRVEYKFREETIDFPFVYKEQCGIETKYYHYCDFLFDNVLSVGESASFGFILNYYENGKPNSNREGPAAGEIRFAIYFKDSLYNQYKQEYMIQFSTNVGCGRVESYLPELVKMNTLD